MGARPTVPRRGVVLRKNIAVSGALVAFFIAVVGLVAALSSTRGSEGAGSGTSEAAALVRADSHRLDVAPDGGVTLVEFLDFECESCAAAYPVVEEIRERYAGQITVVARYFPGDGHYNAQNAAVAVEAAARQGRFEDMYRRMYESQPQWGERQSSEAPLFREFAVELGLDMAAYDAAVADPATLARVLADRDDGLALGVRGTPTFFLDGRELTVSSAEELLAAVDEAVRG